MSIEAEDKISENRTRILSELSEATKQRPELIAVSKQQPDNRIAQGLAAGVRVFGENRVQEAQKRWGETFAGHRDQIELHLIGPLQSNKAEDACALFDVIQTLDREKLAKALVKAAEKTGHMPRMFVQVNTGEEPQKSGVLPKGLSAFLKQVRDEYDLHPEGLMCIPPIDESAAAHFILLKTLAQENGLENLSMGMSSDYVTAAKLGATHVRVGSALFGER